MRDTNLLRLGFSVPEIAAAFNCCGRLIWKEIYAGRLAHTRIGRRVIVTQRQLDEYLERNACSSFDARAKAQTIRGS